MEKENPKIEYDNEEDILMLSKGRKIKASIDIGDFIIDIDHNDFVAGLEIINATEHLGLTSKQLMTIDECSMSVTYKPNNVYVTLLLRYGEKKKDISIPLKISLGHSSVSTQKTSFAIA